MCTGGRGNIRVPGIEARSADRDRLIFRQIDERNAFHRTVKEQRREHAQQLMELQRDVAGFERVKDAAPKLREEFDRERERPRRRDRDRGRDFER